MNASHKWIVHRRTGKAHLFAREKSHSVCLNMDDQDKQPGKASPKDRCKMCLKYLKRKKEE